MGSRKPANAFDLSAWLRSICADMAGRLPQLSHVDVSRVVFACNRTRKPVRHGVQASLTPLRFPGGTLQTLRGKRRYAIQQVRDAAGREMLYILRIYLPRFFNQPPSEKLCTIVHELWHIGPEFDGDLRRFPGRCYAHSHSEREYDKLCRALVERWLALSPPSELLEAIELDFAGLCHRHGRIVGQSVPTPRLIPISGAA